MNVRPPKILRPASSDAAIDVLHHEIVQEKASTLGRLTREFETALTALREFESAHGSPGKVELQGTRERLLDAAADALWWFVVQRESCGLRNTEAVLREYRVPAAVRVRMGVVRKPAKPGG